MTNVVDVRNLDLAYQDTKVLSEVDFSVTQGEFFVIVGPNGSGKTTLLKSLAGIESFSSGDIHVLGQKLQAYSKKKLARTLAYVPQSVHINYPFTVKETVLMGRSPHIGLLGIESKKDEEKAESSMRVTKVDHLADRNMDQLSGGEQQRVLIARAICQEADIVLLDEPTSSLDLAHQVLIMDMLEDLQKKQNMTILMVAHDLNLASLYGERIMLLKSGRVYKTGHPKEVLSFGNLEDVFNCVLLVDQSSLDGLPRITVIPGRYVDDSLRGMSNTDI